MLHIKKTKSEIPTGSMLKVSNKYIINGSNDEIRKNENQEIEELKKRVE
jgi:hypothetical protein